MKHIIFEEKLLEKLLSGDDPILDGLRKQYKNSTMSREFTGAGFYTNFIINDCEPVANGKSFQIGDVNAVIDGDDSKIGFVLFVKDGFLNFLEGYTITLDEWINDYSNIALRYNDNDIRNIEELRKEWRCRDNSL